MKKIYLCIMLSFLSLNLIASTYIVELKDSENNFREISIPNEDNLIELINETSFQHIQIKSIILKGETLDAVKRGGEGGEGG